MDTYSDQELWHLIQRGDRKAFEALYHRYARIVFHQISKRVDSADKVEDLVQDVFLSLWERREKYQPQGDLYPYLYGIAINRVLNHYRSNRIQPKFVALWNQQFDEKNTPKELPSAFQQAHREELEYLFDQTINSLPPRMRQVYKLRYEQHKTIQELSTILSTSPNTIHNQLKSIRKRFIKNLQNSSFLLSVNIVLNMLLNH